MFDVTSILSLAAFSRNSPVTDIEIRESAEIEHNGQSNRKNHYIQAVHFVAVSVVHGALLSSNVYGPVQSRPRRGPTERERRAVVRAVAKCAEGHINGAHRSTRSRRAELGRCSPDRVAPCSRARAPNVRFPPSPG